jgi:hypothetical protein
MYQPHKQTLETRAKIRLASKGNKYALGHKHTAAAIEKIRLTHLGKKLSKDTLLKLSNAKMGHFVSKETCKKISLANKGKPITKEHRDKIIANSKINPNFGMKNKHHSPESKKKMSIAVIQRKVKHGFLVSPEARIRLRTAAFEYAKTITGCICPRIGQTEKLILDKFESIFKYPVIRQYKVNGFFLDGYIPELHLAIEIDEKKHDNEYYKQKDAKRQEEIEKVLNCKFIRVLTY